LTGDNVQAIHNALLPFTYVTEIRRIFQTQIFPRGHRQFRRRLGQFAIA
jgi:hypothetical protein